MSNRPSVLIVDDHESIREPLSAYLRKFDFEVEAVADGKAMRQRLEERSFSLIVLDIMLSGENGLSLCRYVLEHLGIPVIFLTAMAEQVDRVAGLEIGADEYIVKPFDPRELLARVRSVLRRAERSSGQQEGEGGSAKDGVSFTFNGWVFDTGTRQFYNPDNDNVPLSTAEYHLLRAFVENANRVLSRSQLLDLTQRTEAIAFDRSIDSQISRLRKKLESDPRHPKMLLTVRGDGYMLAAKVMVIAS